MTSSPTRSLPVRIRGWVLMVVVFALIATIVIPADANAQVDGICTGEVQSELDDAKASFTETCGNEYSDTSGVHSCTWVTGAGWECTGPDARLAEVLDGISESEAANPPGTCSGDLFDNIDEAKASYGDLCGEPYSDTSGQHRCDWDEGWRCSGPDSTDDDGPTPAPAPASGDEPEESGADLGDPLAGPQGDGSCNGHAHGNIEDAKASYGDVCGQPYSDTSGQHRCDWDDGAVAWRCTGPNGATDGGSTGAPVDGGEPTPEPVDPIFDQPRDTANKPPTPAAVSIVGGELRWEMPSGPLHLFQVTRNAERGGTYPDWGQLETSPGDGRLTHTDLGGSVQFSLPVSQFSPGDRFTIQAIHPYDITVSDGARFSASSRFAMISNPGPGQTIGNFLTTFGTSAQPEGAWIGNAGDWEPAPQWSDDFNGSGLLANRPEPRWYFARTGGNNEVTPSFARNRSQSDQTAILNGGRLEMSARRSDGAYSYIATASDDLEGYVVDPTNGVFVEASVRLDRMTPANNAWWAFWLMAPGDDPCQANGDSAPNGSHAYDGHARTGTEIDVFEFVPDLGNGFNQAIYRYENLDHGCPSPGEAGLQPFGNGFTYEGHEPLPGVDLANYSDGEYHRLGLYYAQDCLAFYMDDELIWEVTEAEHPGWVTPTPRESIRLSWEIQDDGNPWTPRGGRFSDTPGDADPVVLIDWVNVWEKRESANGLCSGGADPAQVRDPEALEAPTGLVGETDGSVVTLDWEQGGAGLSLIHI